jgi:CRISPR-associated endoribonuclease Cas6
MKVEVFFKANTNEPIYNTNRQVHGWLLKNIANINPNLADWLHNEGFVVDGFRKIKPLNFSPLIKTKKDNLYKVKIGSIRNDIINAIVKSFINNPTDLTVKNNESQSIYTFKFVDMNLMPYNYSNKFYTLSPIILKVLRNRKSFFSCFDEDILNNNIKRKYRSIFGENCKDVKIIKENMKQTIIPYKHDNFEQLLVGYWGDFELDAQPKVLEMLYYLGIGCKNSCGYGCIEVRN